MKLKPQKRYTYISEIITELREMQFLEENITRILKQIDTGKMWYIIRDQLYADVHSKIHK